VNTKQANVATYLVTHGEASVVVRWSPQVRHESHIRQIHQVQPSVQHKPSRLPMRGRKVFVVDSDESEGIEEEETKDDQYRT
jgi:hypothetical protein